MSQHVTAPSAVPAQVQIADNVLPAGSYRVLTPEEVAAMQVKHEAVKAEMKAERLSSRDWLGYFLLVDCRDRLEAFLGIMGHMTDTEYWQILGHLWTDTEAPSRVKCIWLPLFRSPRRDRRHLMSAADHTAVKALPDLVQSPPVSSPA
jgi:hypothetical protein